MCRCRAPASGESRPAPHCRARLSLSARRCRTPQRTQSPGAIGSPPRPSPAGPDVDHRAIPSPVLGRCRAGEYRFDRDASAGTWPARVAPCARPVRGSQADPRRARQERPDRPRALRVRGQRRCYRARAAAKRARASAPSVPRSRGESRAMIAHPGWSDSARSRVSGNAGRHRPAWFRRRRRPGRRVQRPNPCMKMLGPNVVRRLEQPRVEWQRDRGFRHGRGHSRQRVNGRCGPALDSVAI